MDRGNGPTSAHDPRSTVHDLIPQGARTAFTAGDDRAALSALRHARDAQPPGSPEWAVLERLVGVLLIHTLREVEGTFALERADPVLDAAGWDKPGLEALDQDGAAGT